MKPIIEPNDFDCLKMKSEIQAKIYAEIKDMSAKERIAYFHIPPKEDLFRTGCKSISNVQVIMEME